MATSACRSLARGRRADVTGSGMKGERLPDGSDWSRSVSWGAYWRGADGRWYAVTPNGLLAGLGLHRVTEHEDGTITVSPSIATRLPPDGFYHGYLERGEWRDC